MKSVLDEMQLNGVGSNEMESGKGFDRRRVAKLL